MSKEAIQERFELTERYTFQSWVCRECNHFVKAINGGPYEIQHSHGCEIGSWAYGRKEEFKVEEFQDVSRTTLPSEHHWFGNTGGIDYCIAPG